MADPEERAPADTRPPGSRACAASDHCSVDGPSVGALGLVVFEVHENAKRVTVLDVVWVRSD